MLKRLLVSSILIFLLASAANAQGFMSGYGATISVLYGKIITPYSSSNFALSQNTATYFPRYNFVENENSSFSIGAPIGVGIGIVTNTLGDDAGISLAFDVPLVLDYNIGFKYTSDNESRFGGYLGAGFGYSKSNIVGSSYSDYNGTSYGPLLRGGLRFGLSKERYNGRGLSVGMFYKKGMEEEKLNTVGFNVLYDL